MEHSREFVPLSVLLICHSYPPVLGGSEIEAQRVCHRLRSLGHNVTVLCAGGEPMPPVSHWIDPYGIPVRIFGRHAETSWRWFAAGVAWTLLAQRHKYDIVYFLMQGAHLATGLPVARMLGKPVVMKISGGNILPRMQRSRLGRLELRWLQKWAYKLLILNDGMVSEAIDAGFLRDQLLWMPNPVDCNDFAPDNEARLRFRAEQGLHPEQPLLLFVGRLAPEKNLPRLLEAFAEVLTHQPSAVLAVIGDGPLKAELQVLAEKLRISHAVRFAGRQPIDDVRKWLQSGDIFALVSTVEGLPCSLIEAMSVGLPSVVSRIPANTQLIEDGEHGLLVTVNDPHAMAAAVLRLMGDSALRERLGMASRQRVIKTYSTAVVVDRYLSLFQDAIQSKRCGS